jgi:dienelactone hydrolase
MKFLSETTEQGVTERRFDLDVSAERVPGIVWTPEGAQGPRPLVLLGHGGTQHKRIENILRTARRLVRHLGYAAVAIDAPGHGERLTAEQRTRQREERAARRGPLQMTEEQRRAWAARNEAAVAEWKATLDAVEKLDGVEAGPVGYWGVSMGTAIGVPFLAAEPRVKCAILGLAGLRPGAEAFEKAARSLTIPILFLFQWHDEVASREGGLALYDAFGSAEKSMHINPGRHVGIPAFERDQYEVFYRRHLGAAKA